MAMRKICVLIICLGIGLATNGYALKPEKQYVRTPGDFNLKYESVSFTASDGYKLTGWFFPAASDTSARTMVISEGDAGNMSYLISYAAFFQQSKYNVLLYDYRGFGKSQPFDMNPDMLTYPEFLHDLNAAVDFAKTRRTADQRHIVLLGFSMGASLSVSVAGQRKDIVAVIADGVWSSTGEVVERLNVLFKTQNNERRIVRPQDYPKKAEPVVAASSLTDTALCLITGSQDDHTTPQMAYEVFSSCASSKKTLWLAARAQHGQVSMTYGKNYLDFILAFINQVSS